LDHCFAVRGIPGGAKKFEESLLLILSPLNASLGVIPFEMFLQIAGLGEPSIAVLSRAPVRTVIVMDHRVVSQIRVILECLAASRDITLVRSLAGVDQSVARELVLLCESGLAARDVALERPLTRVYPLVF
jgi:hypothetical protein